MKQEKEAKLIISFPVIIPDDYSITGFRRRNPDNFYEMKPEMIDRYFRPSRTPKAGQKMIAEVYELNGEWPLKQCINFIEEKVKSSQKPGLLPNAVGLTLAFEQGERYLKKLRRPWEGRDGNYKNNSQLIFGLDTSETFWWQNDNGSIVLPCLYSHNDAMSGIKWKFELQTNQLLGKGEECLLLFRGK